LLPVHAVAGHYRSRSHFEAQDYLESGADQRMTSGWLNRAVLAMPAQGGPGQAGASGAEAALSVGMVTPLLMRGPAHVGSWAPPSFSKPEPDLYARIAAMNAADPVTGPAISEGLRDRGFSAEVMAGTEKPKDAYAFPALAAMAGRLLAAPSGPRVAALELGGWDTHAGQMQRLRGPLGQLDAGLDALKTNLGDAWAQTAVLVMTEFGRTARINGTQGTDHGTAGAAFLLGGAVAGGRVLADWPGLAPGKLFENRDLAPTTDVRGIIKGLLTAHLGLPASRMNAVLPGSGEAALMGNLIRT
jgi:uncharacterized protein (DUF1501 family)